LALLIVSSKKDQPGHIHVEAQSAGLRAGAADITTQKSR